MEGKLKWKSGKVEKWKKWKKWNQLIWAMGYDSPQRADPSLPSSG
jgi:hypothetical protein